MIQKTKAFLCTVIIATISLPLQAAPSRYDFIPLQEEMQIAQPVIEKNAMVVSQEKLASKAGVEILKQGGNAVDAAAAVGFALAVTLPRAGNIGGGGFMLIYLKDKKKTITINYREKAPELASKEMFLDENGDVDYAKISGSYKATGVPGTVAGLIDAQQEYGELTLKQVMAPAIKLAENGFPVSYDLNQSLITAKPWLAKSPAALKIFYKKDGSVYKVGEILKQKDLANSLKLIS